MPRSLKARPLTRQHRTGPDAQRFSSLLFCRNQWDSFDKLHKELFGHAGVRQIGVPWPKPSNLKRNGIQDPRPRLVHGPSMAFQDDGNSSQHTGPISSTSGALAFGDGSEEDWPKLGVKRTKKWRFASACVAKAFLGV